MIDVESIQNTLKTWVRATLAIPTRWENEKENVMVPATPARAVLTGPLNVESVGEDYVQYSTVDANTVQPTVVGHREFDVMVRVTSRSQTGNKTAQFFVEKLRTALARPSTTETFSAAGIAVLNMSKTTQFDAPFEERMESIASATLRVTACASDADDSAQGVLTAVGLTTTIEGEDGQVSPSPPNLTDEVITAE